MVKGRNVLHKRVMVIVLLVGLAIILTVSGCEKGPSSSIDRIIQAFGDLRPLPEATEREFQRFVTAFQQYTIQNDEAENQLEYFRFAFKRIRTSYVKAVDEIRLIDAAIAALENSDETVGGSPKGLIETSLDAMTRSLDPHSTFLNASEFRESFIHTKGEFGGLGIEVTMQNGLVKVISPIEDTPAERAGLKSGDFIIGVDGQSIKGLSLAEAVRRMRGPSGKEIILVVRRSGRPDFTLELVRAVIKVRAVRWRLIDQVAYIRVSRFSEKVKNGISKAFVDIRGKLGREPAGVILDLRNNPGGLLEESVLLADAFLDDGKIVSIRGRTASLQTSFEASDGDLAAGLTMVVLVNSGSASASEIVVSALKNQKRATIMGTRTFGKGSVQTIIPMPREGALKLTTALYYGADGHTIQARGVLPDILVRTKNSDKKNGRRESDLPGSIPKEKGIDTFQSNPSIFIDDCPIIHQPNRAGNEKIADKLLGCAIKFIETGSQAKFLASISGQK